MLLDRNLDSTTPDEIVPRILIHTPSNNQPDEYFSKRLLDGVYPSNIHLTRENGRVMDGTETVASEVNEKVGMNEKQFISEDVEKQEIQEQGKENSAGDASKATEYEVAFRTKLIALGLYFLLNLTLTLQSKMLLGKFAFPYLLTACHTGTTAIGCHILRINGYIKPSRLGRRERLVLVAFSTLFTINIAISNVSLAMVSVAFHQIVRSSTPFFAVLIYRIYFGRSYSTATYLSLIPIMAGVGMVTYGDYCYTVLGFSLTLLGVVLAALKTVVSNRLMTGNLALPATEILLRMSPLAAAQSLLYAVLTGEHHRFLAFCADGQFTKLRAFGLLSNSIIAFMLNICSFHTNKVAGALTITVCGNLKQVLTVAFGILLFDVQVGFWNGVGMIVALSGAAVYSMVELKRKRAGSS